MPLLRLRMGNELRAPICFLPFMLEKGIEPARHSKEKVSK